MSEQEETIFGIDLGTTYSCIAYVDQYDRATIQSNKENSNTTPSVVLFEEDNRIVGEEAKKLAKLYPTRVVEMVKRHMGEANWRFDYGAQDYTAEEISSYILRKMASDAEELLAIPVKDVVITCPAYFGVPQREATARAGQIAGLNVLEVINEPTAAAINYGLQKEQDQVVLVYDLGGGTFDITVIEINGGVITVIATGGDSNLGGRNWDEAIVTYLAEQWINENGDYSDPTESLETMQELWERAEQAKFSLTQRNETSVSVAHAGMMSKVTLTRDKFNELTSDLLGRTIAYTKETMRVAAEKGYSVIDQILLVGGSTKMPQIKEGLEQAFNIPLRVFEPDAAVAKGAALYGKKLLIDQKVRSAAGSMMNTTFDESDMEAVSPSVIRRAEEQVANEMGLRLGSVQQYHKAKVTNVASHSFGIVVITDSNKPTEREVISNLVVANDPLPVTQTKQYGTREDNQDEVILRVMETAEITPLVEQDKYDDTAEIGMVTLTLPGNLPEGAPVQVTFELNRQGRLVVTGKELYTGNTIETTIETKRGISDSELQEAKARANKLAIS